MNDTYLIPEFLRMPEPAERKAIERPILFSGAMVRAILAGTKTQTRRVVKPQPEWTDPATVWQQGDGHSGTGWYAHNEDYPEEGALFYRCPYAQPGARLYVREAWGTCSIFDDVAPRDLPPFAPMKYYADGKIVGATAGYGLMLKARPSIHMPRRFSRILLEITAVRVERLQDISFDDALAEGVADYRPMIADECKDETPDECARRLRWPQRQYELLWENINGPGSWGANPFVWCVSFRRVES